MTIPPKRASMRLSGRHPFFNVVALMVRASRKDCAMAFGLNVVAAVVPGLLIYLSAAVVDSVVRYRPGATLWAVILLYVLLVACHEAITTIAALHLSTLEDAVQMTISAEVNQMVAYYPSLDIYEKTTLRELVVLSADAGEKLADMVNHIFFVVAGVAMLAAPVILVGRIAWWIPMLLVAGALPVLIVRVRTEQASWGVRERNAGMFNGIRLLDRIFTQPAFAKDLRMFRMQAPLLTTWRTRYTLFLQEARRVRMRGAWGMLLASLFAGVCLYPPFAFVIDGFSASNVSNNTAPVTMTPGTLVVFFGCLVQISQGLSTLIFHWGDVLGVVYTMRPCARLRQACDAADEAPRPLSATSGPAPAPDDAVVTFRDVRFRYPDAGGTDEATGEGEADNAVSATDGYAARGDAHAEDVRAGNGSDDTVHIEALTLRVGDIVAIVGNNGAGKTTILKLLSRLYVPTSGVIRWGHPDVRVLGVHQDFARFPLSVLENLATTDTARAAYALEQVGLAHLAAELTRPLTVEQPGGIDLSGGQWQRLAIARTLVHVDNADLLVFDEPTAALDPESEASIMEHIIALSRRKPTVIVSHRLALTRRASHILVLEGGRIIEQGTHDSLLAQGGKYTAMFESQARLYR